MCLPRYMGDFFFYYLIGKKCQGTSYIRGMPSISATCPYKRERVCIMAKVYNDVFAAIEVKFNTKLTGFRHVERKDNVVIVRAQVQDAGHDNIEVFKIFPDGTIVHAGTEFAFID